MYSVWCDVLKVVNVQPVRDQVIGDQGLGKAGSHGQSVPQVPPLWNLSPVGGITVSLFREYREL